MGEKEGGREERGRKRDVERKRKRGRETNLRIRFVDAVAASVCEREDGGERITRERGKEGERERERQGERRWYA